MDTRWNQVSADPNSRDARMYRRRALEAALRPPIENRAVYLSGLAKGKTVLDIGCVDQLASGLPIAPLHRILAAEASQCVGVDIDENGVSALRAEGFDARLGDITGPEFKRVVPETFELVVAGEIIEHITNFDGFFANVRESLAPEGHALLTSPNPHGWTIAALNMSRINSDNVDHTVYHFPSGIAELCDRFGFELVEYFGNRETGRKQKPLYLAARAVKTLLPRGSTIDCESLVYVVRDGRPE